MSSRAIWTSPPSMVVLRLMPLCGSRVRVFVLKPGVKSNMDCMMTASRSRTALAILPISTSLYMLMEASRVKKKLCSGRKSYQSLFKNLVSVSRLISTPSISRRAKSAASSSSNMSLMEPLGEWTPMDGSIFSMRLRTSVFTASSFRMFVSRSFTWYVLVILPKTPLSCWYSFCAMDKFKISL